MTITQQAEDDRPREKLMMHGAQALSTAELLAILVGSGAPGITAVELMQQVLHHYGDKLRLLGQASIEELTGTISDTDATTGRTVVRKRFMGLGEAKAVTLLAACELCRRRQIEELPERMKITSIQDLVNYFRPLAEELPIECFFVLCLNNACQVIKHERLSIGGMTETTVDVRRLMRTVILSEATHIAICHNHPSGNKRPSNNDNLMTARIQEACDILSIHFIDHIIIVPGGYYSYAEEGKLIH